MITSPNNEKLKLIRRLGERKHREREGLFVVEGEDLLEAAAAAGIEPVLTLIAGEDVEPRLLDAVSTLGSGTRAIGVYPQLWSEPRGPVCAYLHAVGDPGNVGAIVRSTHALVRGTVVLGPGCADPYSSKAVRASMGSIFAQPLARSDLRATPLPRVALSAHGGRPLHDLIAGRVLRSASGRGRVAELTVVLGAEREGLPPEVVELCDDQVTIPLRGDGAESLNVAAAAAITLHWISSRAEVPLDDDA